VAASSLDAAFVTKSGGGKSDGRSAREINTGDTSGFGFGESSIEQLLLLVHYPKAEHPCYGRVLLHEFRDLRLDHRAGESWPRLPFLQIGIIVFAPELGPIVGRQKLEGPRPIGEASAYPVRHRPPFLPREGPRILQQFGKDRPPPLRTLHRAIRLFLEEAPDFLGPHQARGRGVEAIRLRPQFRQPRLRPGRQQGAQESAFFPGCEGVGAKVSK
jgi:hypothetical protein